MDSWPQDHQRHKRTFHEMSQHTSLSPSPFFFGHPASSTPLDNPPNLFERRRTSHPHNEASRSTHLSPDFMADPRPLPRPSLEHRTSQTVIDLTDDAGEPSMESQNARFLQRFLQRPPQLDRSDALALEDIIDLTEDVPEDEIQIIESRPASRPASTAQPPQVSSQVHHRHRHVRLPHPYPRPRPRPELLRDDSLSPLFVPQEPHDPHPMPREIMRGASFGRLEQMAGRIANFLPRWGDADLSFLMLPNPSPHEQINLDYAQHPFVRPRQPKPQHQPPPAAQPGFTRSPAEDDIVICPACQQELVAKKVEDERTVAKKPSGKAQSKKDREEHPFWVVKECGHVYCNSCYQRRKPDKKNFLSLFPEYAKPGGKSVPVCAVEGCDKDVGDKKHWVGVFI